MTNLLSVFHKIEQNKKKLISNLFGSKKVELVKYGHKLLKLTTHPSRWKKKHICVSTILDELELMCPNPTKTDWRPGPTHIYFVLLQKKKMENREPKDG